MQTYPSISVIILTQNGLKWLKIVVPSVLNSDYPPDKLELIVVDNGSIDGSIEYLKTNFIEKGFNLALILNKQNLGWSPGNNQGMRQAKGDILVCLSNDMEVDRQWLKELVNVFNLDSKIGVVQCNSIRMSDRKSFDSAINYLDKFGYGYGFSPEKEPKEVFYAEGMAFAVRSSIVPFTGLLDDYFFMEYDDMDFCWRVRLAGFQVFFAPASVVYHARGGTAGSSYLERKVLNKALYARNHITTIFKNYSIKNIAKTLPVVVVLESAMISYLFSKRHTKFAIARLQGNLWAIKDMKKIMNKRMHVQYSLRKMSDDEIMASMGPFIPAQLFFRFSGSLYSLNWVSRFQAPKNSNLINEN